MKKLQCIGIAYLIIFFAVCTSCGKTDKNAVFLAKLHDIDVLITAGNTEKAIKKLDRLERKAVLPIHYLSIAKRQSQLKLPAAVLQTVQTGLKKHPDNDQLEALLVYTLLEENRAADAVLYAEKLIHTPYAGIGTEAYIKMEDTAKTYNTPIPLWKEGFLLTGEQIFLQNAGVLLAYKGNIADAASLRRSIPQKEAVESPYFWSCLAYDLGNFKPVIDDLFYSLVYADMAGLPENNPKAFEYARRHLLLAADASAGLKKTEDARGFWQSYIDRYPEESDTVFYNMAMTANTEEEKITALVECITADPAYYPAAAQYVRAWTAWHKRMQEKNALTELLESKDFFSLEMERDMFESSAFTFSAAEVLKKGLEAENADYRFLLEKFRTDYFKKDSSERSSGEMWRLLETHSDIPLVRSYARWFFARSGDLNAAFSIQKTDDKQENRFYEGLQCAVQGASSKAIAAFSDVQKDPRYTAAALVNKAYLYYARNESAKAVDYFIRGAAACGKKQSLKSTLLYEAACIYAAHEDIDKALLLVKQALENDPHNERARVLQRKLKM